MHNWWFKANFFFFIIIIPNSAYLVNFNTLYYPSFRKIKHNFSISTNSALNISIRDNIFILYNILFKHLDTKVIDNDSAFKNHAHIS